MADRQKAVHPRSRYVLVGFYEDKIVPQIIDFSKGGWEEKNTAITLTVFVPGYILYRDRSKYKPHQGAKEIKRRLSRIRHRGNDPQEGKPVQ